MYSKKFLLVAALAKWCVKGRDRGKIDTLCLKAQGLEKS